MSDQTYRIDNDGFKHYDTIEGPEGMLLSLIENGVLVPDTTLALGPNAVKLLDALTKEDNDE